MNRVPSLAFFFPAWVLGALGVLLAGVAQVFYVLLVPAGALLLLAARRIAIDPKDPWNAMNRRMPRIAMSGLNPEGTAVRALTAGVIGLLGIILTAAGMLGPFGVWTP